MRLDHCYDADSIAARCMVRDRLAIAAREHIIHEARGTGCRAPIAEIGRLLVRLGQSLQGAAHQPIYREETVQW